MLGRIRSIHLLCEVVYGRVIDVATPARRVRSGDYSAGLYFLEALNRKVSLQCQDTLILVAWHHVSMIIVALELQ